MIRVTAGSDDSYGMILRGIRDKSGTNRPTKAGEMGIRAGEAIFSTEKGAKSTPYPSTATEHFASKNSAHNWLGINDC